MKRQLLAEHRVGTRTINGTDFPVEDQLHRTGEREWVVTRELCSGTARSSEAYRSEQAAREAFDRRIRGRPPRAGAAASEVVRLRVTADERKAWERAAGDLSLSEWIREGCNARAQR